MTKKLLNFGFKNLLVLASLSGCAQLKMKQPMAQFLAPQNESSQFLGVSEQIEQQIKPVDATTLTSAQVTHANSKVTTTYLGGAIDKYYLFIMPSNTDTSIGIGVKKLILDGSTQLPIKWSFNIDAHIGGTEKNSDPNQSGMNLIGGNIGTSIGWNINDQSLLYVGGAIQGSSVNSKYFIKTQCSNFSCSESELKNERSWFSSNSMGIGFDQKITLDKIYHISIKASNQQWSDTLSTKGTDLLFQFFVSSDFLDKK